MALSPDDVRNVAFGKPPIGYRGYNIDEVDAFLELLEASLRGELPAYQQLSADDIRDVKFSKPTVGPRGYDEHEVDAFLDHVQSEMEERKDVTRMIPRLRETRFRTGNDVRALDLTLVRGGSDTYKRGEVDAFLERAANALDGKGKLTSKEIRSTLFNRAGLLRRGYLPEEIEGLLDELRQEFSNRGK
ncbi:DivIVA domain-containing protein [Pseudonocardiaceae bacterium YIM PH 21723]|nr:DivIVA domain-containing protein [Pseudonocardiaceae bacterium YIM PH 21723]